jgi:hypothetical protein
LLFTAKDRSGYINDPSAGSPTDAETPKISLRDRLYLKSSGRPDP